MTQDLFWSLRFYLTHFLSAFISDSTNKKSQKSPDELLHPLESMQNYVNIDIVVTLIVNQ